MNAMRKIVALTLIAFMVLAISGAKIHFHFCGTTHKLLTHIHISEQKEDNTECECLKIANCCMSEDNNVCSTEMQHETCLDFYKKVETDLNYLLSSNIPAPEIIEITLLINSENYFTAFPINNDDIQAIPHYPPPDPLFTSVFLL